MLLFNRLIIRRFINIKLRDYQKDAINTIIKSINTTTNNNDINTSNKNKFAISLPTGSGKTIIFTNLIKKLIKSDNNNNNYNINNILILVHRRELAFQTYNTINKFINNSKIQLEMGNDKSIIDDTSKNNIIIASIQSINNRLNKYNNNFFNLIIIDEAHHSISDTYIKILKYFNTFKREGPILLGFSATFERHDNKQLSKIYDEVIYHKSMIELIEKKWLVDCKFTTIEIDSLNLNEIEISNFTNDFNLPKLSKIINTKPINKLILITYLKKRQELKLNYTLIFAVDINHVKSLYDIFTTTQENLVVKYITNKTNKRERDLIINEFKLGKINILINCGILTEGTDIPIIDSILLCRPTKSRNLLIQMIGRGLRLFNDKEYCHIIDFINSKNVGIVSVPNLIGINNMSEYKFNDMTMNELLKIKEEQAKKNNIMNTSTNSSVVAILSEEEKYYNKLINENKNLQFNLTLIDYNDIKSFTTNSNKKNVAGNNKINDFKMLADSEMNWIIFQKNSYGLYINKTAHLRLYGTKNDTNKMVYTLKLYRDISQYDSRAENKARFRTSMIAQHVPDIHTVIGAARSLLAELHCEHYKHARWRYQQASEGQRRLTRHRLLSVYDTHMNNHHTTSSIQRQDVIDFVDKQLTKGTASNLLFATSIARVYPAVSLLHLLARRLNMTRNSNECRVSPQTND